MIVDLSKIPSTCGFSLQTSEPGYLVKIEERVRGRTISAYGRGDTPQEAIDSAIKDFTS